MTGGQKAANLEPMVGTQSLLAASGTLEVVLIGVGILVVLVIALVFFRYFNLWLQCIFSNAGISLINLIGMSLRKINPSIIVRSKIAAVQAGIAATTRDMEAHYLAGGNVVNVIRSLIAADRANIPMDFRRAAGIDLAGRNVLEAVQTCVNPKVIDVPAATSGKETVSAVAKDGIQLLAKARVTVRTNIDRLIGGATEETIIARVGEGIVTSVGSAESHKNVLENPDLISRAVMDRGLDAGTAFEILSIDIADVDVGLNIGAKLQADQAEADKRVAQAKAEERAAMARAREQEMQALIAENRAKVVLAEAEIPKAMAAAFRDGNFGVMDYYNLRNVQADTKMRKSIAGEEGTEEENK